MAAETATPTAPAASAAPAAPVAPPPDPRLVAAGNRLAGFYNALISRQPKASGPGLLPGVWIDGKCQAQIGVGTTDGPTLAYAAALVLVYGPDVVGAATLDAARAVIQGWVDEFNNPARWERGPDPLNPRSQAQFHLVDTRAFRADFDLVVATVEAAGPGVVNSLLEGLGHILSALRSSITSEWSARIHDKLAQYRDRLLETELSGKHMREDPYEVYRVRGAAGRAAFGRVVVEIGDPLLTTLYEHPDSLDILRGLARSAEAGKLAGTSVVAGAERALTDFRSGVASDVQWRYPEFLPAVLERIGLPKIPHLAEYLTAVRGGFIRKTFGEWFVEIAGWAILALSLGFTGGTAGVVLGAAGVVVAGTGLGVAFLRDRDRVRGAEAYAFSHGEQRIIEPRFPIDTAISLLALMISAALFGVQVRGLLLAEAPPLPRPSVPPPRPGAPSAPVRSVAPAPAPTAPAAKATGPATRLTDKANQGTGAKLGGTAPSPSEAPPPLPPRVPQQDAAAAPAPPPPTPPSTPPTAPSPPPRPATPPPPPRSTPSEPAPTARPSGAPRTPPEELRGGKPSANDRAAPRVPQVQRGVPADAERIERDAIRALDTLLDAEAEGVAAAQKRLATVLDDLRKVPENDGLVRRLEVAEKALQDKEAFGRLAVRLSREVEAVAGLPVAEWETALGLTTDELRGAARLVGLTEETAGEFLLVRGTLKGDKFFREAVVTGRGFLDHGFPGDDHGVLNHALQDVLISERLAQEGLGTAADLRRMLADAKAPAGWTDALATNEKLKGTIGARAWAELWDAMGPKLGDSGLYSPEFFSRALKPQFPELAPSDWTVPKSILGDAEGVFVIGPDHLRVPR